MTLSAGTKLGPYEILSPLGAGGMGEVYRARDARLGRDVAVKVLPEAVAADPESLARFERETRAVAALSHPNILAIHDVGREGGVSFAVLELLEGETLRQRLATGPLTWRAALEIAAPVAEGLAAAHAREIVHRDLKPENIFLTADGRVKILDFGLARRAAVTSTPDVTGAPTADGLTAPGIVLGTLAYLSPEQARGQDVDGRSDVFAFGSVLYEMLAGRRAFAAATASESLVAVLRDEPRDLAEIGIAVPASLDAVLRRCLRKNPPERFQSASDLAFSLRAAAPDRGNASGEAARVPVSVAVLPFLNVSSDAGNEYFSDGITEELINALAQVPGLRVAARTSSFLFKERREDIRAIAERLGVSTVLEGSVRKAGGRVRISAQLINAADGYHLWSESHDQDMSDVFAVQEEIARAIVRQLRVKLGLGGETLVKRHTSDPEAYNLYLKGRYFWNRRSAESSRKAIGYFQEAIARDPDYALAYAGLADSYLGRDRDEMARAKEAAAQAVALDEKLAEGHAALARTLLYGDWNWEAAEREFRRAIELNPAYPESYHMYSHFLVPARRVEESLAASRRALELDPLSVSMVAHGGWHSVYCGRFEESMPYSRAAIDMDPTFFAARIHLGMALEQVGRLAEAIEEFRTAGEISAESSEAIAGLGHAYAAAGRGGEARRILEVMAERAEGQFVSSFDRAIVHAGLGENEAACAWLERAAEDRLPSVVEMRADPRLTILAAEPRFAALARRIGLPD